MIKSFYFWGTVIAVVIFLLLVVLGLKYFEEKGQALLFISLIQLIVLVITAVIIFFYTYETHKMRREMVNQSCEMAYQRKVLSTPFIHISLRQDRSPGADRWKCWAKNVGEGTAIKINLTVLHPINGQTPKFREIEALSKGDESIFWIEKIISDSDETSGEIQSTNFLKSLMAFSQPGKADFKLEFKNILNDPTQYKLFYQNLQLVTRLG